MSKNNAEGSNVLALPTTCRVEKCGKKGDRLNFCTEHYMWFKEGLVNKRGEKPTDFDKKFQDWLMRSKKAA